MRRLVSHLLLFGFLCVAGAMASCADNELNPQPLPPGEENAGRGGDNSDDPAVPPTTGTSGGDGGDGGDAGDASDASGDN